MLHIPTSMESMQQVDQKLIKMKYSIPHHHHLLLLLLVGTMVMMTYSLAREMMSPMNEVKAALNGYSARSDISNHHSIPRDQYDNHIGGGNGDDDSSQGSGDD